MSGIAGIFLENSNDQKRFKGKKVLADMMEKLRYSGSEIISIKEVVPRQVWLGKANSKGNDELYTQPSSSISGNTELVFNGSIYNQSELDNYLIKHDYILRTKNDTERLAEIIDRIGIESLNAIDGMFSFASLDKKTNSLFLAIDRYAQKSLYFIKANGIFAFASELSPLLLLHKWIPMKVSLKALGQYMFLGYVPAPLTAVNPIKKLEPGKLAIVELNGSITIDRYFSLSNKGTLVTEERFSDLKEVKDNPNSILSDLLNKSIATTTVNSAGILISGGISSTLVAAKINQNDKEANLPASQRVGYTLKIHPQESTSTCWAKELCSKWGWKHREIDVKDSNLIKAYISISGRLDEPIANRSLLINWILMQAVNPFHKIAIGGNGGDEFFMGHHRQLNNAQQLIKHNLNKDWADFYWKNGLAVGDRTGLGIANSELNIQPMKEILSKFKFLQYQWKDDPLVYLQWLDILTNLPGYVLPNIHRAGTNWGVEIRSPLLNTRLTTFALILNPYSQISTLGAKLLLKDQLRSVIGNNIPEMRNKESRKIMTPDFTQFIRERIDTNLKEIDQWNKPSFNKWFSIYIKYSVNWNEDNLFAFSVYLDWLKILVRDYPQIE